MIDSQGDEGAQHSNAAEKLRVLRQEVEPVATVTKTILRYGNMLARLPKIFRTVGKYGSAAKKSNGVQFPVSFSYEATLGAIRSFRAMCRLKKTIFNNNVSF